MNWVGSIAIIGGLGTTFSFAPQVYKVYKQNCTEGLSPYMIGIHFGGVTCWLVYGILINDYYVVGFNGITMLMVFTIIAKFVQSFCKTKKERYQDGVIEL
jgi:MtN3 and saliva related transmembrane protein